MYDIIGDVHGYAQLLKKLLKELGYQKTPDGYSHPARKAVFVGDFINRGPQIRKSLRMVRKMVENGNALAILGNHELSALIVNLKDKKGSPLIRTPRKSFLSVLKTLGQFTQKQEEWESHVNWMRTLPLFLELGKIKIVHACWSDEAVQYLKQTLPEGKLKRKVIKELYKNPDSELSKNIWLVSKGVYLEMPHDLRIRNNKGVSPQSFRTQWWQNPAGKTFNQILFESKYTLPEYNIPEQLLPQYLPYEGDELVFFGHYCRGDGPFIISPKICCVDSCVTGTKTLTAYRWDGEEKLLPENLIQVKP